ncbi:(d)CMP kinase [uncultured Gilvimarinus sp.]|mgnify:CR=1 FL=1|uniref:(d)CMP kinase n=1 Tax=uncultured Gilvimarinus sp. TaxID=1689143 RepID=UPI0030EECE5A|tara:strand:- start:154 stop:828 length:675 start_codon:yes stop_codon:yes gene_type:complete
MLSEPVCTIVTIDGPSGAGKGTLSQLLAQRLGYHLLDSGALYRLVALASLNKAIAVSDEAGLVTCAANLDVVFSPADAGVAVHLEGADVTAAIRQEAVSMRASEVAAIEPVRRALLQRQRDFAVAPGLVADGRDMGTTVFANAQHKFYLTASAEARAQRRYQQLIERGEQVDLAALIADIEARDQRDQSRESSPLKPAADAELIDSTHLSIEQVLAHMMVTIGT